MRIPDFFIVGAPKCGTTAMDVYLKQHPEIYIPDRKEIHFFGSDIGFQPRINKEQYLALFEGAQQHRRAGESSVWYLYSERAAREIKEFSPNASIIIMVRNPVDLLYSLHSQLLYTGVEEIEDFSQALEAEEDRKRGLRIPPSSNWRNHPFWRNVLYYREVVKLSDQIKRYLEVFPRERIHVILFDQFRRNTSAVYQETLRFLEVSDSFQPNFEIINPNKRIRSRALQAFLNNPPRWARILVHGLLPKKIHRWIYLRLFDVNTRYESRRPIDPELRRRLQAELRPEVERLSELLETDLTFWCKD